MRRMRKMKKGEEMNETKTDGTHRMKIMSPEIERRRAGHRKEGRTQNFPDTGPSTILPISPPFQSYPKHVKSLGSLSFSLFLPLHPGLGSRASGLSCSAGDSSSWFKSARQLSKPSIAAWRQTPTANMAVAHSSV